MRVISNEHHQKPALNRIQVYVVCNAKRNITLDDIARHVGMNRTPFCLSLLQESQRRLTKRICRFVRQFSAYRFHTERIMNIFEALFIHKINKTELWELATNRL